jgi:guanine deaminase
MAFQKKFLKRAVELASQNVTRQKGGPFAALVVKHGKIISEGFNSVTTNNDPSAHAEIVAIRKACTKLKSFELKNCEIYTSCEPCPMCLGAIYWARPKAVYFAADKKDAARAGFDDDFIYKEINKDWNKREIIFKKVDKVDGFAPFSTWIQSPNKIEY